MKAIQSLLFVLLVVFISLFLTWFFLTQKAQSNKTYVYDHAFFKSSLPSKPALVSLRGDQDFGTENSIEALQAAADLSPETILWLDVTKTSDHVLVLSRREIIKDTEQNDVIIPIFTYGELQQKKLQNPVLKITDVLQKFPKNRIIFNVPNDQDNMESALVEGLGYKETDQKYLIHSDRDQFLKIIKKRAPMWAFATSAAQNTQFLILSQLSLSGLMTLDRDVFLIENINQIIGQKKLNQFNYQMLEDLKKRKMKVFVGDITSQEQAQELISHGVDGIMSSKAKSLNLY